MCGTWQAMCVTYGMPCVIMHGHVKTYKYEIGGGGGGGWAANAVRGRASNLVRGGPTKRRRRKGKEKGRKGKEKGRKIKENERRKVKKKGMEERKKKEEKEGVSRSE